MTLPYRTSDAPVTKLTDEHSVLYKYVDALPNRDREKFMHDLSEDELIAFCASLEEFKLLTGRMPRGDFPHEKPEFQKDVRVSATTTEEIQRRFDDMSTIFPERRDLMGLENLANDLDKKSTQDRSALNVSVTISLPETLGMEREMPQAKRSR